MTDDERKQEGAEEEIEDLESPAETQSDVVGGRRLDPCGNSVVPPQVLPQRPAFNKGASGTAACG